MVRLRNAKILLNEPMSRHTTLRIGGRARLVTTNDIVDVMTTIVDCQCKEQKLYLLGGGTNSLIASHDIDATFLTYTDNSIYIDKGDIVCSAGVTVAEFLRFCVEHSIIGYEFMAGIPGTMGGAVKGNAGGVDVAIGDYVLGVNVLVANLEMCGTHLTSYLDGELQKNKIKLNKKYLHKNALKNIKTFSLQIFNKKIIKNSEKIIKNHIFSNKLIKKLYLDKNQLYFSYRKNNLPNNIFIKNIILKCEYSDREIITKTINKNLIKKISSQPTTAKSAGSVFMREGDFVPSLEIDRMGLKGKTIGGAKVSEVHAGFVVNSGNASSEDVVELVRYIRQKVVDTYGIRLKSEIKYFD